MNIRLIFVILLFAISSCGNDGYRTDVESTRVEVYFSGQDNPQQEIIKLIDSAKSHIRVAIFTFTSIDISKALYRAFNRGVDVEILVDEEQAKQYTAFTYLQNKGVPGKRVGKFNRMHHKFIVVDKEIVQTGSFNYTKAANNNNAENIVIIKNKNIAQKFLAEYVAISN